MLLDWKRRRRRLAENLDLRGDDLDVAGRKVGVGVALGAPRDLPDHAKTELGTQRMSDGLIANDDLRDAARVAQVDEGDAAVVATPGDPAGKGDVFADGVDPEAAGVMGADHAVCSFLTSRGRR